MQTELPQLRFNVPDNQQIISERLVNAPVGLVYQAWTNPLHLARWWGPKGFTNTFHTFDLKPGGTWSFTMHGPDKGHYNNECVFIQIKEPSLIAWNHLSAPAFQVIASFAEERENTWVNFRMIFDSAENCDKVKFYAVDANEQNLDRLEAELKRMKGA